MLLGSLLVLLVLVCIALATVILLQRSEGGALGMGGGPSGFMSARGAGDLLTRITSILAGVFFFLCLLLTILSGRAHTGASIVDRLKVEGLNPDSLNHGLRPAPAPGALPAGPSPASQFEAPRPEVHTAPSGVPTASAPPPTSTPDSGARGNASSALGYQPAPQTAPTTAPHAATPKPAPAAAAPSASPPAAPANGQSSTQSSPQ